MAMPARSENQGWYSIRWNCLVLAAVLLVVVLTVLQSRRGGLQRKRQELDEPGPSTSSAKHPKKGSSQASLFGWKKGVCKHPDDKDPDLPKVAKLNKLTSDAEKIRPCVLGKQKLAWVLGKQTPGACLGFWIRQVGCSPIGGPGASSEPIQQRRRRRS